MRGGKIINKSYEFVIIGGPKKITNRILPFFKTILGAESKYFQTDSTTAELVKYIEDSFLATKVTFCNEFFPKLLKAVLSNNEDIRSE